MQLFHLCLIISLFMSHCSSLQAVP
nr:truncated precore/core protein [Hepatitis B virus]